MNKIPIEKLIEIAENSQNEFLAQISKMSYLNESTKFVLGEIHFSCVMAFYNNACKSENEDNKQSN